MVYLLRTGEVGTYMFKKSRQPFLRVVFVSFDYLKNRTILSMSVPVFFFLVLVFY